MHKHRFWVLFFGCLLFSLCAVAVLPAVFSGSKPQTLPSGPLPVLPLARVHPLVLAAFQGLVSATALVAFSSDD